MRKITLALLYGAVIAVITYHFSDKIARYLNFADEVGPPITNAVLCGVLAGFAFVRARLFAGLWLVLVLITGTLTFGGSIIHETFGISFNTRPLIGVVVSMVFLILPLFASVFVGNAHSSGSGESH